MNSLENHLICISLVLYSLQAKNKPVLFIEWSETQRYPVQFPVASRNHCDRMAQISSPHCGSQNALICTTVTNFRNTVFQVALDQMLATNNDILHLFTLLS